MAEHIRAAGGQALALQCDVRDRAQVDAAVKRVADEFGRVDIMVANAGAVGLGSAVLFCRRTGLCVCWKAEGGPRPPPPPAPPPRPQACWASCAAPRACPRRAGGR